MMKKITAIALLSAAALALSACAENTDKIQVENDVGTTSSTTTTTENAPEESSGEITEEDTEESTEDPDDFFDEQPTLEEAIAKFSTDSFTTPDGTEVPLTDAVSNMWDVLFFDFAYIRYAEPIYSDTVSDPDLFDFESFEFRTLPEEGLEQKPFKVVEGDVLDNGMTVAKANYAVASWDTEHAFENGVELEGELTLEGILFKFPEDDYMFDQDDVIFYPNPTDSLVPSTFDSYFPFVASAVDLHDEFAFITDGGRFSLGNVHEMDVDIADWFENNSYVKVRVTLDGIQLIYSENFGSRAWSSLKSAERLDS